MEKITKEELMKKLKLTEEEMEKIAGGSLPTNFYQPCYDDCIDERRGWMYCANFCAE